MQIFGLNNRDHYSLSEIYFLVFPSEGSTPNNFELKITNVQLPNMKKEVWTDGTKNKIVFDKPIPYFVAPIPIKCHFPCPGLVVLHCIITDENGNKPLDKNGNEILLAQRTLSGEIGQGYSKEPEVNVGQIPIIVIDYQSKILIWLTVVLTILTGLLVFKDIYKLFVKLIKIVFVRG